ncbi:MAG: hypothetical protein U0S49_01295 [Rhodospirillales bacterium]|nr:hypothetical protein [Rhodospirillales bacterium]
MADLAGLDQLLHRAGDVFHRHVRINAVLVEEVDAVGAQALQRLVGDLSDALRAAVEALGRDAVARKRAGRSSICSQLKTV